jgi:hypothetical protein
MGGGVLRLRSGETVRLTKAATHDVTVTTADECEMRTDWSGYLAPGAKVPRSGSSATLEIEGCDPVEVQVKTMEKTGRYRRLEGVVR